MKPYIIDFLDNTNTIELSSILSVENFTKSELKEIYKEYKSYHQNLLTKNSRLEDLTEKEYSLVFNIKDILNGLYSTINNYDLEVQKLKSANNLISQIEDCNSTIEKLLNK